MLSDLGKIVIGICLFHPYAVEKKPHSLEVPKGKFRKGLISLAGKIKSLAFPFLGYDFIWLFFNFFMARSPEIKFSIAFCLR